MYDTVECLRLCNLFRVNFSIDSLNCELRCFGLFEEKKKERNYLFPMKIYQIERIRSHMYYKKRKIKLIYTCTKSKDSSKSM